eukprot:TRINITY_DN49878_c0_g1_i1.p1 TRINITY_DN49878_c0_g1~~TRINITY_DN49878_c0_g1_i1.p1  ORF type:complete len:300 (-),score=19.28 TRINITY_DN49878_c0_g1_i1:268-1125(-)
MEAGIFPGAGRDVKLIPELLVLAFPCGTYSSQRNWSFDFETDAIRWGELCLSTYNGDEQGLPKQQPYWRVYLGECVFAETQKWWYDGSEIHTMGHRNVHNPNGDDRCLETRSEHGPAVGVGRCIHPDRIGNAFGVDVIRQGLHIYGYKEYSYANGEMHDGNGLCLDVWRLPNCSVDGKFVNSSEVCIDQWRFGQSTGSQMQDLREFVSPKARAVIIIKLIGVFVAATAIMLCCCKIWCWLTSSVSQRLFANESCRELHLNPVDDGAEMAEWAPLADDSGLTGNFS